MFSAAQPYNGRFCPYQKGRAHLQLNDFRLSGTFINKKCKSQIKNEKTEKQYFSEDVLIQMVTRFMDFVEAPFVGYKIKPQYAKIIYNPDPENERPASEFHGRPHETILSALYLGFGSKCAEAQRECERTNQYPGSRSRTTFFAEHDPHRILEQMRREERDN